MYHARYFEPKAQVYRGFEREHLDHKCDECWLGQVCPEALPIDADPSDWKECRDAGWQGGTLMEDGHILCRMCY